MNEYTYTVGAPVMSQVCAQTATLSGAIGPKDWRSNAPLTQEQVDKLEAYQKRRYPKLPRGPLDE